MNVPHDLAKQLWDHALTVIGLLVDSNHPLITMPETSRVDLLQALDDFVMFGLRTTRRYCSLRDCQALAGHVSWALNADPRLRPGFASLYSKMGGPYHPTTSIHINAAII